MSDQLFVFPIIYADKKHGRVLWDARVAEVIKDDLLVGEVTIRRGYVHGNPQTNVYYVSAGKNQGKKNETSPYTQAIADIRSKWISKIRKEGYFESTKSPSKTDKVVINENVRPLLVSKKVAPMLAEKYYDHPTYLEEPFCVQPKLDGVRCLARIRSNGKAELYSRKYTLFSNFPDIEKNLKLLKATILTSDNIYVDGELFTTEIPFENISGACRTKTIRDKHKTDIASIRLHVFDYFDLDRPDLSFHDRYSKLQDAFSKIRRSSDLKIELVDTKFNVYHKDMSSINEVYAKTYEGSILRNPHSKYAHHRTKDLLKLKTFFDEEFKIVGFCEGSGKDVGTVIWICETNTPSTIITNKAGKQVETFEKVRFNVRPRGTAEYRQELFKNGSKYIGEYLTVRYQELGPNSVPRFGTGIDIRSDGI